MKKESKIVKFVKEHKKEVVLGVLITVVGGIVGYKFVTMDKNSNYLNVESPFGYDHRDDVYRAVKGKYKGIVNGKVFNVPVTELGAFGEKLLTVEGVDEASKIRMVFGTEGYYGN